MYNIYYSLLYDFNFLSVVPSSFFSILYTTTIEHAVGHTSSSSLVKSLFREYEITLEKKNPFRFSFHCFALVCCVLVCGVRSPRKKILIYSE